MTRTSRHVRITDTICPTIRALKGLREEEETTKESPKSPVIDSKNWSKMLEAIQEWFCLHLVITKAPLSYVVREEIDAPPHPTDPPFGEPNFANSFHQEEIIARAPIRTTSIVPVYVADFQLDNKSVWELLWSLCRYKD